MQLALEPGETLAVVRSPAPRPPQGRLLLLHGLGGCADSRYLRRTLLAAHRRGWEVVRMNARGTGEGAGLARRLPHAGRWPDVAAVVEGDVWTAAAAGTPLAAIGFSLGGSILLRYLGEAGSDSPLSVAVAVNPPTDLAWSLRELERPANRLYHAYYVRALSRGLAHRARLHPDLYTPPDARRHRSVRALDEDYVAPDAGFASAEAYYAGCSAGPLLHQLRVPALILSSRDDPFVPPEMLRRDVDQACNPELTLALVPRGGHMGYLEWRRGRLDFWAAEACLEALEQHLGLKPQTA